MSYDIVDDKLLNKKKVEYSLFLHFMIRVKVKINNEISSELITIENINNVCDISVNCVILSLTSLVVRFFKFHNSFAKDGKLSNKNYESCPNTSIVEDSSIVLNFSTI